MSNPRIPGPGNRFYTTWKFMRDPYVSYREWKKRYGKTFLIKALNGNVVATCDTENVRRIFAAPPDAVGQFAVETMKPLLGGSSVILVEGQQHRRERSLLSPSFHGERINNKAEQIRDVARRVGDRWTPGETIRMMDSTLDVSLEVIIRVVFGVQSQERVEEFKGCIQRFVGSFHPVLAFSRLLQRPLLGLSPWNKFIQARTEFYQMLMSEIERCRDSEMEDDNMLSRLMHSQYEDGPEVQTSSIRDQLVTMLLAGHETTQIAMAWAMSWLHRHPEFAIRLREELDGDDSIESILRSQLLDGICNESLRLNPIISDVIRVLRKPMRWSEFELPANTNVAIAISLVHEDPEIYSEPMSFNPDRWTDRTYKPNEFLPFGGGVRRCIGAPLAILEMKIVVATWIKDFRFLLPADAPDVEPVHRRNITIAPKSGIPLRFVGRAPQSYESHKL